MSDKVALLLEADRLRRERDEALRERDEARAAARVLWEIALTQKTLPALIDLRDRYPWMSDDS